LLVIEHAAEPGPDGLFRKYGALFVGGKVLPWHLVASRTWMVKSAFRVSNEQILGEERRYNLENPHRDALARVFASANIEYGRVDYGLVAGRLQIYEINTNPAVVGGPRRRRPSGRSKPDALRRQLIDALRGLAAAAPVSSGVSIPMAPRRGPLGSLIYRAVRGSQCLAQLYLHRSEKRGQKGVRS
jgi:hypothetical protein